MKNKPFIITIVATVIAIVSGTSYYFYNKSPELNTVSLEAPEVCKIGQLVVLDASMNEMDDITWDISPITFNFRIIDGGKKAIFSSEKAEDYTITVAIAYRDKVHLVITKLVVTSIDPDLDSTKIVLPGTIENILPDPVKIVLPINPVKIVLPIPDEDDPELNIVPWLPSDLNLDPSQITKIIKNLNILSNLIDKDRFETKDEIIQAVIWSIKRSTKEDEVWEPFTLNFLKYLENSISKQDCARKVKNILTHLERVKSAKT